MCICVWRNASRSRCCFRRPGNCWHMGPVGCFKAIDKYRLWGLEPGPSLLPGQWPVRSVYCLFSWPLEAFPYLHVFFVMMMSVSPKPRATVNHSYLNLFLLGMCSQKWEKWLIQRGSVTSPESKYSNSIAWVTALLDEICCFPTDVIEDGALCSFPLLLLSLTELYNKGNFRQFTNCFCMF